MLSDIKLRKIQQEKPFRILIILQKGKSCKGTSLKCAQNKRVHEVVLVLVCQLALNILFKTKTGKDCRLKETISKKAVSIRFQNRTAEKHAFLLSTKVNAFHCVFFFTVFLAQQC